MKYAIAILAILTFASCKKDYKCTCKDKNGTVVNTGDFRGKKDDIDGFKQSCYATITVAADTPVTCVIE